AWAVEADLGDVFGRQLVLAPTGRRDEDRSARPYRQVALGGDDESAGPEARAGRDDGRPGDSLVGHTAMMAERVVGVSRRRSGRLYRTGGRAEATRPPWG